MEPQLCNTYSVSEDMRQYTFTIENATFSDCSPLVLADVLATLEASKESDYYGGRFTHISTTLLVSPYQNHEGIVAAGEKFAGEYGVTFLYRDFRVGFREGQAKARELGLYMQKYCGCVFSEEDRYAKQIRRDRENSQ